MQCRVSLLGLLLIATATGGAPAWALAPKQQPSPIAVAEYFTPAQAGVRAAEISNFTPELIQARWETFKQTPQRGEGTPTCGNEVAARFILDCGRPLDLGVILRLNLRAVEVWEAMVACQPDAEAARLAYFGGKRLCTNDQEDRRAREMLRAFAFQVDDFLLTSSFDFNIFQGSLKTPTLHPLLAERLVEAVMSTRYLMQQMHRGSFGGYYMPSSRIETENVLRDCSGDKGAGLEGDTLPATSHGKSCSLDGEHASDYWARLYRNARRMLAAQTHSLEARGCGRFGLWPHAALIGATNIGFFNGQSFIESDWGEQYGRVGEDPAMPSCWEGAASLLRILDGPWWGESRGALFPGMSRDAKRAGDEAHMNMRVTAHEHFYRMKKAWQK